MPIQGQDKRAADHVADRAIADPCVHRDGSTDRPRDPGKETERADTLVLRAIDETPKGLSGAYFEAVRVVKDSSNCRGRDHHAAKTAI
jgi:hypothetical protein